MNKVLLTKNRQFCQYPERPEEKQTNIMALLCLHTYNRASKGHFVLCDFYLKTLTFKIKFECFNKKEELSYFVELFFSFETIVALHFCFGVIRISVQFFNTLNLVLLQHFFVICKNNLYFLLLRKQPIAPYNSLTPDVLLHVFLWVFQVHSLSRLVYHSQPINSAAPSICFQTLNNVKKEEERLWEPGLFSVLWITM